MSGTILSVTNGGSIWLLLVEVEGRLVDQPIEPRYLRDLLEGEGLEAPADLVGREVELSEDGLMLAFT